MRNSSFKNFGVKVKSFKLFGIPINSNKFFPAEAYIFFSIFLFLCAKNTIIYFEGFTHHSVYSPIDLLLYLSLYSALIFFLPAAAVYAACVRFFKSNLIYMLVSWAIAFGNFYTRLHSAENMHLTLRKSGHMIYQSGDITPFGLLHLALNPLF